MMVSTDPVADMLTRIRNAAAVNKDAVSMPHSKLKEAIARILSVNNFVGNISVDGEGISKELVIGITRSNGRQAITEVSRISKPGRRMYTNADKIPTYKGGRGLVIISTSKGIMTGADAKAQRLGGELICQIY
jgi:small subunit ribosomal protein S8